jgi:hypothetical protein
VVFIVRHFPTLIKPRYVDDDTPPAGPREPPTK